MHVLRGVSYGAALAASLLLLVAAVERVDAQQPLSYCYVGFVASPFDCSSVYCASNSCPKLVGDFTQVDADNATCSCRFARDVVCPTLHSKPRCLEFKKFCNWRRAKKTCYHKANVATRAPTPEVTPQPTPVPRCPSIPLKGCAATYKKRATCNKNHCCKWVNKTKKCGLK